MSQDNPGVLHDATNSWNGYNHQGKIALYFAVKEITKLIPDGLDKDGNEALLGKHFLEVEYTEDFSIGRIEPGGVLCYDTIHQVKDRKDTGLKAYESAIQGLAVNMVRHPEVQNAYLHTTRELSDEKGKTFEESVRDMVQNTAWIGEQEIKAQKKKDPVKRQEELDWLAKVRAELPALWQKPGELDKIRKYPYEMPGGGTRDHCSKEEAAEYLKRSLREFYGRHDPERDYKQSKEFVDKSYQYLLEKLNEHVVFRSKHYSDKKVQRHLPLSDLYGWLISDEIENMGEAYHLYHIKGGYLGYLNECCGRCKEEQENHCEECRVPRFREMLRSMKPDAVKAFLFQTNPDVSSWIGEDNDHRFLQDERIEDPFWLGLRDIEDTLAESPGCNTARYIGADHRAYLLTTLAKRRRASKNEISRICTEIQQNRTDRELRFDGDCLISRDIDVESVQESALSIKPSDICGDSHNITASRKISIVSLDNFREEYMRKEHEES